MMSSVITVDVSSGAKAFNTCTAFAKSIMIATAAIPQEVLTIINNIPTSVDDAKPTVGDVKLDLSKDTNEETSGDDDGDVATAASDVAASGLLGSLGITTLNSAGMKIFQVANDIELSCLACALTLKEDALTQIMTEGGVTEEDRLKDSTYTPHTHTHTSRTHKQTHPRR